jgi:peroxiredoxin Q/BCP
LKCVYLGKLEEGQEAPEFLSVDQDGNQIDMESFKGKKLILFFYPKDNTSGCTAEACNLRDNYEDLKKKGFEIIGVSPDSEKSHRNFISKHNLPFKLISDSDKKVLKDYGAWGEKKMYGRIFEGVLRTTFIISEDGKIEKIIPKVNTKDHTVQILSELK